MAPVVQAKSIAGNRQSDVTGQCISRRQARYILTRRRGDPGAPLPPTPHRPRGGVQIQEEKLKFAVEVAVEVAAVT